jgi:hypothetical protein
MGANRAVCCLDGFFGPLAQLVEQLTLNQLVVGSIPTRPTNFDRMVEKLRSTYQRRNSANLSRAVRRVLHLPLDGLENGRAHVASSRG